MDIYFCDQCAARVSDADLHRGHGIKKHDTVVCGLCIERGLGLDLLSQVQAAGSGVALAGTAAGPAESAESAESAERTEPDSDAGQGLFVDDGDEDDPTPGADISHESQDYLEHESAPSADAESSPLVPSDDQLEAYRDVNGEVDPAGDAATGEKGPVDDSETAQVRRKDSDDLVSAAGGFAALGSEELPAPRDADELIDIAGVEAADEPAHFPQTPRATTDWDDEPAASDTPSDDDIMEDLLEPESGEPAARTDSSPAPDDDFIDIDEDSVEQAEDAVAEGADDDEDEYEDEYEDDDDDHLSGYDDEVEERAQGNIETLAMGKAVGDEVIDDGEDGPDGEEAGADGSSPKKRRRKGRRRGPAKSGASKSGVAKSAGLKSGAAQSARSKTSHARSASSHGSSSRLKASSSSSRSPAAKSPKASRRAPASKKNNMPVILGSIISVLVILIIAALVLPGVMKRSPAAAPTDPVTQMRLKVEKAKDLAISAQRANDLAQLEAAQRAIQEAQQLVYGLTDNPPPDWTEQDLQNELHNLKFQDLQGQSTNIRNRIGILKRQGQ